jgi:hypothetical protein
MFHKIKTVCRRRRLFTKKKKKEKVTKMVVDQWIRQGASIRRDGQCIGMNLITSRKFLTNVIPVRLGCIESLSQTKALPQDTWSREHNWWSYSYLVGVMLLSAHCAMYCVNKHEDTSCLFWKEKQIDVCRSLC